MQLCDSHVFVDTRISRVFCLHFLFKAAICTIDHPHLSCRNLTCLNKIDYTKICDWFFLR